MKRAVFLALFLALTSLAHADGLRLVSKDLPFRETGCPTCTGSLPLDSTFSYRGTGLTANAGAEAKDTTAAFSSFDWALPGPWGSNAGTAAGGDTISWVRITLTPEGTSPTVTADTAGVIVQVSDDDGSTWSSLVWTSPAIDPDVAAMGQAAVTEVGTSNCFKFVLRQQVGGVTSSGPFSGTNAVTANMTYGFRLIRFIFTGDFTGKYRCRLEGFKSTAGPEGP